MDKHTRQLTEIMHKIAFKVPWQKLKLGEDELKVLDKATGDQMVEIAYKNRIPFSKFIHNADELIDEFNEHKFKQYIKDVKELKNALEEPFKCKETREIQIEPIEVDPLARERELIQAAIEEVLEGQFNDDATLRDTISDGQEKLAEFMVDFFNGKGPEIGEPTQQTKHRDFSSAIVSHNELGTSISLQRHDFASRYLESSFIDTHLRGDPLNRNEEAFGEATFDDLAQLGMFDGSRGRELFNKLCDQSLRPIEENTSAVLQPNQTIPELHSICEIEPPLNNIDNTIMEIPPLPDTLPPIEPLINVPVDQTKHAESIAITNADQSLKSPGEPRQTISDLSYAARLARIEKTPSLNEEDEQRQSNPQKQARKPRVRRPKRILGSEPVVNIIKPLSLQPKKPLKMRKEPNRVEITLKNVDVNIWDIINNIDKLPFYQVPSEDEIEEIANLNSAIIHRHVEIPQIQQSLIVPEIPMEVQQENPILPEIPTDIQLEGSLINKRSITSPLENITIKRPRLAKPIEPQTPNELPQNDSSLPLPIPDMSPIVLPERLTIASEIPMIEPSLPENILNEVVTAPQQKSAYSSSMSFDPNDMVIHDARDKSASIDIQPQLMINNNVSTTSGSSFKTPLSIQPQKRTADILASYHKFRKTLNMKNIDESRAVTPQDIIFGQLRNVSKDAPIPALPEITTIPDAGAIDTVPNSLNVQPEEYREFKKKGVEFIQYKNKQGKIVQYEEYNIQNMLLYLQVRKYMKIKNTPKLNIQQLVQDKILKIKNVESNHTIMVRLWRLCDRGFFKGEWSDDDKLLAIELPHVTLTIADQDKENIP